MKNLTVAQRIIMMIVVSVSALLIVGSVGLYVANKGSESIHQINDDSLASVQILSEARQAYMEVRINIYRHVMSTDAARMQAVEKGLEEQLQKSLKQLKDYEKLLSNDEDKKLLEANVRDLKAYAELLNSQLLPKSRKNEKDAANEVLAKQLAPLGTKVRQGFDNHLEFNKKLATETTNAALARAAQGQVFTVLAIVFGVTAIGLLAFFLIRELRFRLSRLQGMMEQVSQSLDFTARLPIARMDELGSTAFAFNNLLDKLQGNLKSIASGAQSVAAAANQMAATSTQVATASHQQSEAASGMAATVEEMTVSINHVGDRAQEANRISSESGQLAASGEEVISHTAQGINQIAATVHDAAERIHELEQHSAQISNVVAVIKEVADQTNLLALNAAIEAARAGEQGRGFAVVADEVRKLAERTASSTQEIARTIETMRASASDAVRSMEGAVAEVNQGVERAQEANDSIRRIGEGSRSAVGMVEEITTAIREQGTATNNIAIQVEKIAQMSEESSAAAEESARAARDLDRLAKEMHGIVAAYKL
ncbi:methyl-accepting chemotaxis protein [Formivibrio citricus]|uniref:Methyl-accepting chemotaxis protein n=1 Tax=Formivibrio citricus TaxID=83765 RepID=A0A1I4W7E5_9NEIS|nr:methyl-accepting chemotaxis protein [Formivibrio citricus]SFN09551.1 methyl-accepting chemotaxis protein [Formivibrio citricus]